jgi:hypothetical protein
MGAGALLSRAALGLGPDVLDLLAGAREETREEARRAGGSVLHDAFCFFDPVLGPLLIRRHVAAF